MKFWDRKRSFDLNPVQPRRLALIFVLFLTIYNLNFIPRPNSDAIPSNLLPFSIIINHNMYLDPWYSLYAQKSQEPLAHYFFSPYKGHYISTYPIALPLAITPFYIPVIHLLHLSGASPDAIIPFAYMMAKLMASMIAALSVVAFYLLLTTLFGTSAMALLLTVAFALGTSLWSQASQHLLQHGFGCLMTFVALICFLRSKGKRRFLLLSGLASALAVAERYNNVFIAALIAVFVIYQFRKRYSSLIAFFAGPVVIGGLLLWYNFHFFNNLVGGYSYAKISINSAMFTGLAGLLVSPSRGLLIYSPFLFASVLGLISFFKNRKYRDYPLIAGIAVVIIINTALVSVWPCWWGGFSYGPRLLTEIAPLLILFIPFIRELLDKSKVIKIAFFFSIGLSIIIHGIGVFCFPKGMSNALPRNIDRYPERLWDIKNSQILVEAKAGLYTEMYNNLLLKITGKAKASPANGALPDSAMRAEIRPAGVPHRMIAGYSYSIPFVVINHSAVAWSSLAHKDGSFGIILSDFWQKNDDSSRVRDNGRTMLWDLSSGASWSDYIIVTAPPQKGTYKLGFGLFQTGAGWFNDLGSPASEFTITVDDSPEVSR